MSGFYSFFKSIYLLRSFLIYCIVVSPSIEGFKAIVNGDVDYIPEIMFSYKGTISDVIKSYEESKEK